MKMELGGARGEGSDWTGEAASDGENVVGWISDGYGGYFHVVRTSVKSERRIAEAYWLEEGRDGIGELGIWLDHWEEGRFLLGEYRDIQWNYIIQGFAG